MIARTRRTFWSATLVRRAAGAIVALTMGCSSEPPRVTPRAAPPVVVSPGARPSGASIGLVLTGGGAFGAWEVGALQAFFDAWREHYGEDPPIDVVAGASTGALIAPFALLGREDLAYAAGWYTSVRTDDLLAPKISALLPFPFFAMSSSSVYGVGYTTDPTKARSLLFGRLVTALSEERLGRLNDFWPRHRLAVSTLDFGGGCTDDVSNSPKDRDRLRQGILASAMAPLSLPPIPLLADHPCGRSALRTPHLDGSLAEVAPFWSLFGISALAPPIRVTRIVVVSAFPDFPGDESHPVQKDAFPSDPKFQAIGDRTVTLLSEAAASHEIKLAKAAIALRRLGKSADEVRDVTGMQIREPIPEILVLAPRARLGWRAFRFEPTEMDEMYRRGYEEGRTEVQTAPWD
jgi:predicted acylesterase/phospholipase RssA